jgi:predicted aspartyl protease
MRQILVFAAIMIALAAVAPKLLRTTGGNVTAANATAEPSRPEPSYPHTASIPRGANGHFEADAVVDGHHMGSWWTPAPL